MLDEVIRNGLAPMLKALGFRKAGRTFRSAAPRCVLVVNVQASHWSTRDALQFTVNVGAFYIGLNDVLQRGTWPSPSTSGPTEYQCHVRQRLGRLTPAQRDVWWDLKVGAPWTQVSVEVTEAVREHGLPWLRAMTDLDMARSHAEARSGPHIAAGLALLAGRRDEATRIVVVATESGADRGQLRLWARQADLIP
ncbi:DUF4304 domain-containing protein [Anaeromyxobacter dehalogenans]|uniref:DUF4304 domain-containing protein n=1 Tax=Anaeromyxobacter dehalogenans TaxID=161493 RepID=UPI0003086A33|nr:DUF4304 domain-containing protein [Anaeromyxobacter dehalogenans]